MVTDVCKNLKPNLTHESCQKIFARTRRIESVDIE